MKKYKLIETYPNSPEIGTIGWLEGNSTTFLHPDGRQTFISSSNNDLKDTFEYKNWEEVIEFKTVFDSIGKSYYHKQSNGKWRCHGKFNEVNPINTIQYTISNDEIGKTRYVVKEPLSITKDGVDLYKGDKYYQINNNFKSFECEAYDKNNFDDNLIIFSTKKAAEEYVLMNKPCLCLNDILISSARPTNYDDFIHLIKKIVKSKNI